MLYEIKSWVDGCVLFSLECGSFKLCVQAGIKAGITFRYGEFSNQDLSETDLSGGSFDNSRFDNSRFDNSRFDNSSFYNSSFYNSRFYNSRFYNSSFYNSRFYNSRFDNSSFDNSSFYNSSFYNSRFDNSSLKTPDGEKNLNGTSVTLSIGPIGSRRATLLAWFTSGGIYIHAGCFFGTAIQFTDAVTRKHGESVHAKEYKAAMIFIEAHAALWGYTSESEQTKEYAV